MNSFCLSDETLHDLTPLATNYKDFEYNSLTATTSSNAIINSVVKMMTSFGKNHYKLLRFICEADFSISNESIQNGFSFYNLLRNLHRKLSHRTDNPVHLVLPHTLCNHAITATQANIARPVTQNSHFSVKINIAKAFCACLKTDRPDGLYPTIVADQVGNHSLIG